jgi:RecA-family ATPase
MAAVPFDEIRTSVLAQAERLLRSWFPRGKVVGHEFKIGNLHGDAGESLSVSLVSGLWKDFATDDSGHDLIDLRAAMLGTGRTEAARELGLSLGLVGRHTMNGSANGHRYEPPRPLPPHQGQDDPREKEPSWRPVIPPPQGTSPPRDMLAEFDTVHEYTDAEDRVTHYVGRIEARDGRRKQFVPLTYGVLNGKEDWHRKAPCAPRPLYGLNRLATMLHADVLLCEGEKAADAAQQMFPDYACISWMGGANAVDQADFAPLKRRHVTIWPDADEPGRKAGKRLQELLPGAGLLDVSDLADGADAADVQPKDPEAWLRARVRYPENEEERASTNDRDGQKAPQILRVIDPTTVDGLPVPPREWVVQDWLPVGHVTLNYGDGGVGKTLLAQQLQTACATGTVWSGLAVTPCNSLGLYAEDDEDELHRRQDAICAAGKLGFANLGNMRLISVAGEDATVVRFDGDGRMHVTELFAALQEAAQALRARLLVLDTAADMFDGNENDRGQVRRFLALLTRLARTINGAVLLNAHPSRAGLKSGDYDGGSTAWSNSARSRWSLARPSGNDVDRDERILTRRKANYASAGDTIKLRWQRGVLVPAAAPGGIAGAAHRATAEAVFLQLLDRHNDANTYVSASKNAGNYAPKLFAQQPDWQGIAKIDFEKAMQALFASREITQEPYGRKNDERHRIVRTAAPQVPA